VLPKYCPLATNAQSWMERKAAMLAALKRLRPLAIDQLLAEKGKMEVI